MNKEDKAKKTVKMTIEREGVKVNVSLDPEIEVKEVIKEIITIKEVEIPVITTEIKEIEVMKEVEVIKEIPSLRCPACGGRACTPVDHPEGYEPWPVYVQGVEKKTEHHDVHCGACGGIHQVHESIIEELKRKLQEGGK